ncbi:MAG: prepilin-type N-terminal cleavage/methylation domain-containing protein [Elusimicrobiota bacterium]|nr:prepilin-type N-terminal cleavage/methylation domain-containing protein [Elusimicrobiota bacterium]
MKFKKIIRGFLLSPLSPLPSPLRRGYTLMELMVVVAIMGVILLASPKIFKNAFRFVRLSFARAEIQKNARGSLSNINRELRQAVASSVVVDQVTGQPPHSRITFTRYRPDGTTRQVSYYQDGKKLYLSTDGSAGKMIADQLKYIVFSYPKTDDDSIVSVSLTFEKATYERATKALQMAVEKVRIMN